MQGSTLVQEHYPKAVIERDYTVTDRVKFLEGVPIRLQSLFTGSDDLIKVIQAINGVLAKSAEITPRTVGENLASILSVYTSHLFGQSTASYVRQVSDIVNEANERVFRPRGLQMINPFDTGLLQIDILILYSPSTFTE